jgi:hypothetical protein
MWKVKEVSRSAISGQQQIVDMCIEPRTCAPVEEEIGTTKVEK